MNKRKKTHTTYLRNRENTLLQIKQTLKGNKAKLGKQPDATKFGNLDENIFDSLKDKCKLPKLT